MTKLAFLAGGFAIWTACVDGSDGKDGNDGDGNDTDIGDTEEDTAADTDDSGDTGTAFYDGPPEFQDDTWDAQCDGTNANVIVSAATDGWVYGPGGAGTEAVLNMYETRFTKDYDEEHAFHEDAHDANGAWTDLVNTLPEGVAAYASGVDTHFKCVDHVNDNAVTYVARVYDIDGNISDCVAWGHDPVGVIADTVGSAVYSTPAEITANCWDGN